MKKPIRTHKTGRAAPVSAPRPQDRRRSGETRKRAEGFSPRGAMWRAAELFACLLTMLMPLKFASIVTVPQAGALYCGDPFTLLIIAWPQPVFMVAAALLLFLTLAAAAFREDMTLCPPLLKYGGLWLVLGGVSLLGLANASCMGYPPQMIAYTLALASYALSLAILLSGRREFARMLTGALVLGGVFSICSGLRQYWFGFDELREHIRARSKLTGRGIAENMAVRIREARVQADFNSCNVYGAYLAGLLPFLTVLFWRFGDERVTPPKLSRRLFGGGALAVMLFLLVKTDSRGAVFSLLAAGAVVFFLSGLPRKWKLAGAGLLLAGVAGLVAMIVFGRGALSMFVRFDYVQSAGRMMLKHPLTGTGWGDFLHDHAIFRLWRDAEAPKSPHNMVMLFGSQCGIAGFAAALAVLAYPVFAVCRQVRRTDWRVRRDFFALVPGLSCLILSVGILLDVGFETAAYAGVLIVFSLLVLMRDADSAPVDRPGNPSPRIVAVLLMLFAAAVFRYSWDVLRADKAYSALQNELNPQYSFEHMDEPGYVPSPFRIEKLLRRASDAAPGSPFPWKAAVNYMFWNGSRDEIMLCIDTTIKLDPLQYDHYVQRAGIRYMFAGGNVTDEVRRDLETARRLAPKNPELDRPDEEICRELFENKEIQL